jgi:amyloid beta precursor protein binding protein 1
MAKPSDKDSRYDRQLRLWGDHGQRALEAAHVCLINATGTGTEILKNLVLPGIGAFTILDPHHVTSRDLGSNFFLTSDKIGTSRATCTTELLSELNSEVRWNICEESLDVIMDTSPDYFTQFSVVVATGLVAEQLESLAGLLWEREVPLLVASSYGFLGYIRLAVSSHEVIESHPDNSFDDLRLDIPFNALSQYMNGVNIRSLDNTAHSNLPYAVVLYKYLDEWRANHDGAIPSNYREKKEFKELIRAGIRHNEEGHPLEEDNFDEAIQNANKSLVPTSVPSSVKSLMDDNQCLNLSENSKNFWFLIRALRDFISNEGRGLLPVRGSIPDMTSSSDLYIELQRLYMEKAKEDIDVFTGYLNGILASVGKSPHSINESEIKLFCRNAAFICFIRTRSLAEEMKTPNLEELSLHLSNPDDNLMQYYVLLRACDRFYHQFKMYPGAGEQSLDYDAGQLKSFSSQLVQEWGLMDVSISDEVLTEFCRYGAGELHSVASYIGGVASQEVIKILTHQYVPLNNTYIYNASSSTSMTANL